MNYGRQRAGHRRRPRRRLAVLGERYSGGKKGTVTPQWGSVEALAKAFGVSTDQIMGTVDVKGQGIQPESLTTRVDKLTLRVAALQAQVDQLLRERGNKDIRF